MKSIGRNDLCSCGSGLKYKKCCLEHEGQFTLFVDEAGNSGSNYLDLEQPFYLVGGWLIPNSRLESTNIIDDVAQTLNVNGELKGTNLSGNKKNQREFKSMFEKMEEIGCKPFLVFAEKKYCIAAKVIETFLDPAYNQKVSNSYTFDNVLKKQLAEKVYNLPIDTLKQFAQAYRLLEPEAMEKSLKDICDALKSVNEHDLADKLSGALSTIKQNTISEKEAHIEFLPNNAAASLNVPAFVSLINHLEGYAREKNISLTFIHDKTKAYEPGYMEVYRLVSEANDFQFQLTDGTNIVMGFKNLRGIQFHDSKESPWIQAADVLISSLNRFMKKVYSGENVNSELLELGKYISSAVLPTHPVMGNSICSHNTREHIKSVITAEKTI